MTSTEDRLAAKYGPRVLYFALRKVRDRGAAEEIAQETLLIAISALREEKVKDPSKIGSFLFGVASNLVKKYFRDKSRLEVSAESSDLEKIPWLTDPEAKVLLAEKLQQVQQVLSSLDRADQDLLRRCFEDPLPLDQLAGEFGISYAAVRKRKSRLLERLKSSMEAVTNRSRMTLTR